MTTTDIYTGNLTANTPSAWVAVPASNTYTIQSNGIGIDKIEFSLDGTNPFKANQSITDQAGEANRPAAFTVHTPVAWARLNPGPDAYTGVKATIVNA